MESAVAASDSIRLSGMLTHGLLGFGLERVQMTFALRLDDSLQALLAPPLAALRPFAEIAVVPLSFT
jgi:hypothetical protein